jgi:dihydroorotase
MFSIEGNIINIDGQARKRVEIGDDGIISAVLGPTGKADVVLADELIFPGFIDVHVHARECADHSWDYKEDFTTAGWAAINGGVVAFADMPNNPVPPMDLKSYDDKNQLAKKSAVDVVLYAGIGPGTKPFERSVPIYRLQPINGHATKQVPYKVFMGQSIGDLFFSTLEDLESAISKYSGQNVSFHCEDPEILEKNKIQPTHRLRRPPEAEISAVDFALKMIKKYRLQGKICHCSTVEGLQKIISAKKSGLSVTVEVTPHHLYFDDTVIARRSAQGDEAILSEKGIAASSRQSPGLLAMTKKLQVNPPIRQTKENRLALIAALKKGDIDYLATDHAPHTIAEKEKGMSGLPHLDTYGPFAAWLMAEHGFTPADIARVCSFNPGKWFNQFSPIKFGEVKKDYAGSLTVLDMKKPVKIEKTMLKTKCGWSPFEGVAFPGRVAMTIIKGKVFKV